MLTIIISIHLSTLHTFLWEAITTHLHFICYARIRPENLRFMSWCGKCIKSSSYCFLLSLPELSTLIYPRQLAKEPRCKSRGSASAQEQMIDLVARKNCRTILKLWLATSLAGDSKNHKKESGNACEWSRMGRIDNHRGICFIY